MFSTEKEELSFYRSLLSKMNASVYLINLDPYEITWISNNPILQRILGMDQKEVNDAGRFIASRLVKDPDFTESVTLAISAFIENPTATWTGVYRIANADKNDLSWIMYSTSTFQKDENGKALSAVCVAFGLDNFNTPNSMEEFFLHLKKRIFATQRNLLTKQQFLILSKILEHQTTAQIAKQLSLSKYTIDDHRKAIYKKLKCKNKAELFRIAEKLGMVS